MKVLVTGGTGIVGIHLLVELTTKRKQVRALFRSESSLIPVKEAFEHYNKSPLFDQIEWVKGDIEDIHSIIDACDNINTVYHAAAFVSFVPSDKEKLLHTNVEGTANVVNACLTTGVETLAYVSSTAAIGRNDKVDIVTEELPWVEDNSISGYSLSKHYAEREVWRGAEEGLNVTMVNPCIVLGPGKWGNSSTTLLDTAASELPFYTDGANAFIDARDVANALIELVNSKTYNQRFLLIGENISFKTIFDQLARALGKKSPSIESKRWMSELAWRFFWIWSKITGKAPTITKQTASSAHTRTVYSKDKFSNLFPDFEFHTVDEAIQNTTKAYLRHHQ
jgi:nucleoside-diphosphate-sugar epimerase